MKECAQAIYQQDVLKFKTLLIADKQLLKQKIPDNQQGWNALHLSAALGMELIVKLLLEMGANLQEFDYNGWTAAHLAVFNGHLHVLEVMIAAGQSVNALTRLDESLVFIAAKANRVEILKQLIDLSAELHTKAVYQMRPLDIALEYGNLACLRRILDASSASEKNHECLEVLLKNALLHSQLHIAEFLLENFNLKLSEVHLDVNTCSLSVRNYFELQNLSVAELDAVAFEQVLNTKVNNDLSLLLTLLRVLISNKNFPRFSDYCDRVVRRLFDLLSHLQVLRLIFERYNRIAIEIIKHISGINALNVDLQGMPLSWLAIEFDDVATLKLILAHFNAEEMLRAVNKNGDSILHYCVENGALLTLRFLIDERHLQPSIVNVRKESLLHHAIRYKQNTMTQVLLKHYRVDPTLEESKHETVARSHAFAAVKFPEVIKPKIRIAVFQGGGVKGIGFYGSLEKLVEKQLLHFDDLEIIAGTSAGAITALLLALGYNLKEVETELKNLNFYELLEKELRDEFFAMKSQLSKRNGLEEFLGKNIFRLWNKAKNGEIDGTYIKNVATSFITNQLPLGIVNSLTKQLGLHDGESELLNEFTRLKEKLLPFLQQIQKEHGLFLGERLRQRFIAWIEQKGLSPHLTFRQLHQKAQADKKIKDLYVAAYNATLRKTHIFSHEDTPDVIVADAVRCSMSIQGFFVPHHCYVNENGARQKHVDEHVFFDGGSLDNYLLGYFDKVRYLQEKNVSKGKDKATNRCAIGFRLVEPYLYSHYEEKAELPRYAQEGMLDFVTSIFHSITSFSKQESDHMQNADEIERTVYVNTLDIDTVEFDITKERQEKLIQSGRDCAEAFSRRSYQNQFALQVQAWYVELAKKSRKEFFDEFFKLAKYKSASDFSDILKVLKIAMHIILNDAGDTLFHAAVAAGDRELFEKLHSLSPEFCFKNKQGILPLDSILFCKGIEQREKMLDYFCEKNIWPSHLLRTAVESLSNQTQKKNYLLKKAYAEDLKSMRIPGLFNDSREAEALKFLTASPELDLKKISKNDLLNYVYLLIKHEKKDLLAKFKFSLEQLDENGMSVLHYFVQQNEKKCVETSFEYLIFPHLMSGAGEFPMDMVFKITSYSKADEKLQQQIMLALLLKKGSYRCKEENKNLIIQLMDEFGIVDPTLKAAYERYKQYDQKASLDAEYKQFQKERNLIQINQEQDASMRIGFLA
jgi:NTE family protein